MSSVPPPTPPPMRVMPVIPVHHGQLLNRRPGAITFLGVSGIIVSIFGVIFSAYVMLIFTIATSNTRGGAVTVTSTTTVNGVTTSTSTVTTPGAVWTVAQGSQLEQNVTFTDQQKQMVLRVLNAKQKLSDARGKLLDNLLTQHGGEIFQLPTNGADETYLAAVISEAGKTDDASADYFVIPAGRIQVSDSAANFRPSTPGGEVLSVTSTEAAPLGNALTSNEIEQVMTLMSGGMLSNVQMPALRKYLADPTQELIVKTSVNASAGNASKFGSVGYQEGDNVVIHSMSGGWIMMDTQGNVIATPKKPAAMWGGRTAFGKVAPTVPAGVKALAAIENGTSVLLSIALFVISIFVLRFHPRSRKLLLWYAALKLISIGVGAVAMYQLVQASKSWFGTATGLAVLTYSGIALVFPLLVLILMNQRHVRNYYTSVGA